VDQLEVRDAIGGPAAPCCGGNVLRTMHFCGGSLVLRDSSRRCARVCGDGDQCMAPEIRDKGAEADIR
jgi:hypothetical protein